MTTGEPQFGRLRPMGRQGVSICGQAGSPGPTVDRGLLRLIARRSAVAAQPVLLIDEATQAITEALHRVRGSIRCLLGR